MLKPGIIKPRLRNRFIIKIGGMKRTKTKEYPEKYDHFKLVYPEKGEDGHRIPVEEEFLMEHFGEVEPKELPFMFFSNDPRMCYDTGYAFQTKQGRRCFSEDGELAWWAKKKMTKKDNKWVEGKNPLPEGIQVIESGPSPYNVAIEEHSHLLDDYQTVQCLGRECPMQKTDPPNCKLNLRLSGFIPVPEGRFEGQDILWSTSYHSAAQIEGSWATLMLQTGGHPAFVPLKLKLEPRKGKRGEIYILSFHADADQNEINAIVAGSTIRGPEAISPGMTPPSAVEMGDAEEFYETEAAGEGPKGPNLEEMMPPDPPPSGVGTVEGKPSSKGKAPEKEAEKEAEKAPDKVEEKPAEGKCGKDEPLNYDNMDMSNLKGASDETLAKLDELSQAVSFQMERHDKQPNQITNAIQTALRGDDPVVAMEALLKTFMPGGLKDDAEQGELPS